MTDLEKKNYELVKKCITFQHNVDFQELIMYYVDKNGLIQPYVMCNDLFYWAHADAEDISEENFHLLQEAYDELAPLYDIPGCVDDCLQELFCCKSRKMRPQTPYYYFIGEKYWPLFDACGELRQDQMDVRTYVEKKRMTEEARKRKNENRS